MRILSRPDIQYKSNIRAAASMAMRIKASLAEYDGGNSTNYRSSYSYTANNSNSRKNNNNIDSGTSNMNDLDGVLQTLSSQVKRLEMDFALQNIPTTQLDSLKDLSSQVEKIKTFTYSEFEVKSAEWVREKLALQSEIEKSKRRVDDLINNQSSSIESIRQRYENSLSEVNQEMFIKHLSFVLRQHKKTH